MMDDFVKTPMGEAGKGFQTVGNVFGSTANVMAGRPEAAPTAAPVAQAAPTQLAAPAQVAPVTPVKQPDAIGPAQPNVAVLSDKFQKTETNSYGEMRRLLNKARGR
jgi:hypothetical protein